MLKSVEKEQCKKQRCSFQSDLNFKHLGKNMKGQLFITLLINYSNRISVSLQIDE